MIDLHCHSYYSDGTLSPEALLNKALDAGVRILALTDHDTIVGLEQLVNAAENTPIKIINGIELSARWKKYNIHVIGLNFFSEDQSMQSLISQQNASRITRGLQIAEQMKLCGVRDAYEKACKVANHDRVGRPHFAQVFVDEGLASDRQTAFKRYLVQGRVAYAPTSWVSLSEAVERIVQANGQAVLAHPLKYAFTRTKLYELIGDFKTAGGEGLEVISGEMTKTQIHDMAELCLRYELLASTGSDYHGDTLSRIPLGRQQQLPVNCNPIWHRWNRQRTL